MRLIVKRANNVCKRLHISVTNKKETIHTSEQSLSIKL